MIGILFSRAGDEVVEIRIDGNSITWRSNVYGAQFFPLDSIDLPKHKVLAEFPDLKEDEAWRDEALKRLKEHISRKINENEKMKYIIEELEKVGYRCHSYQKQGGRVTKWHG